MQVFIQIGTWNSVVDFWLQIRLQLSRLVACGQVAVTTESKTLAEWRRSVSTYFYGRYLSRLIYAA